MTLHSLRALEEVKVAPSTAGQTEAFTAVKVFTVLAQGSAPTAHIWHTFHSTGTGNPTCQVCFASLCCPTFLWSQVLETYSPKEAMKAISLSRQDLQTNAAFYPLREKQKPSEGLSVLLHLITGKSQVLHCIGSPI